MVVISEYARKRLIVHVAKRVRGKDAIDVFADLMETHGIPKRIQSDNGPEMVANAAELAGASVQQNDLHHTGQPLGYRPLRIPQQSDQE